MKKVNKKHLYVAPGQKLVGVKAAVRKRKVEQVQTSEKNAPIIEEYRPKLKQGKLNKKSFSSMITSFTTSFVDAQDEKGDEEDFMGLNGDEFTSEFSNSQSTKVSKEDSEFDSKMLSFKFGLGKKTASNSDSGQKLPANSPSQIASAGKANKTNISKFALEKRTQQQLRLMLI